MPFVDVMSPDAYGRYNRRLAQITNLPTAVYWSELLLVCSRVTEKKKYDNDGYFILDRDYMTRRITLSVDEQLEADAILTNLEVLEAFPEEPNKIRVNLEKMCNILVDADFKPTKNLKKKLTASKAQKSEAKRQGVLITMKKCVSEIDPDLYQKYEAWVDSVYASKRFLTKVLIQNFENAVNAYSSDKQVRLNLLDIAVQTGYTDPEWVINQYTRSLANRTVTLNKTPNVSTGINTDISF